MTTAVRVPLFRFWLGLWVVFFVVFFLLTSLGFWKDLRDVGLDRALAETFFFGALFLTCFLSWAVVHQWKTARMTLPLAVETSMPLFTSAAARMKCRALSSTARWARGCAGCAISGDRCLRR